MSYIDWAHVAENPDVKVKVLGRDLLNLRAKINSIEEELSQTRNDLRSKINSLEELLSQNNSKLVNAEESLKQNIKSFDDSKFELDLKLNEANTKIAKQENELSDLLKEKISLEETIINKNKEFSELKDKISKLNEEISELGNKLIMAQKEPKIIKELKELMFHKGFLSDKELNELLERR